MGRLAVIAVLALSACSPVGEVCDPATCASGCCDADGVCRAGIENVACGVGGNICNSCPLAGAECIQGVCRVLGKPDAGAKPMVDSGTPMDAGMLVAVEFMYDRIDVDAGVCPVRYVRTTCDHSALVSTARLQSLRQSYSGCTESMDGGAVLFRCKNCEPFVDADCYFDDGGFDHGSVPECTWPEFAVADFCAWQVP